MNRVKDQEGLERLAAHIKKLREQHKISQEKLAFKAEISVSQLSRIEVAMHNTSFSTLTALCRAFDMTIEEFFADFSYPAHAKKKTKK
jgi:transcriptional regulator with XRE-family HTH domain